MLEITRKCIEEKKAAFEKAGIHIGNVDIDAVVKRTHDNPRWVHFGAGNLFKAYHAVLAQRLIEGGKHRGNGNYKNSSRLYNCAFCEHRGSGVPCD
jgi:hypothetical protein